jgi:hypothetical protein|eukprot:60331_1
MTALRFKSLAMAALMLMSSSDAFTVVSPSQKSTRVALQMSASAPPPPVEQVKVASSTTPAAPLPSTSNLPPQQELAEKAKTQEVPAKAAPKSKNLAAGSGIAITDIRYDGLVPRTEADEYVEITNNSNAPMDISGYYVYVASTGNQGPTYYFPKGTTIKANQAVRIYTNEVHMETGGYTYGSGKALWSNNGGLAVFKDAKGKKIGEFKYKPSA